MAEETTETEDNVEQKYEELVRFMAGGLLGTDDFQVESKVRGNQITLKLITPDDLRGRVIGRGGRIARSLRTLLDFADYGANLQPTLDIVD